MKMFITQCKKGSYPSYLPLIGVDYQHINMHPMQTWSDEELEFWANLYRDNNIGACDIRFDTFMEQPHEIMAALAANGHIEGNDYLSLLPVQERIQRRLDLRTPLGLLEELENDPHIVNRNGTYIEPLHHHAHPRRKRIYSQ